MLRLVGEMHELLRTPQHATRHVAQRLCALLNLKLCTVVATRRFEPERPVEFSSFDFAGPLDESEQRWMLGYVDSEYARDPVTAELSGQTDAEGVIAAQREQVVCDRDWYGGAHFAEYRRHIGIDDCLYSYQGVPGQPRGVGVGVGLNRGLRDRKLGPRERAIMELLLPELTVLHDANRATARLADELPPRMRQVLDRLLTGASEKQIARALDISAHTVHSHVKALYRRLNVSSRAELVARWVTFFSDPGAALRDARTMEPVNDAQITPD